VTITTAMILGAGRGLRMRPLTDATPKPLIPVQGRPLIDHAIDRLVAQGVRRIVVNVHHLADRMEGHLAARDDIEIVTVRETALLETGGGVVNALPKLGSDPIFVVNADSLWLDGAIPALDRLARRWEPGAMAALLMLQRTTTAMGYDGPGDYFADQLGRAKRRSRGGLLGGVAPYVHGGVHILDPTALKGRVAERFRLSEAWNGFEDEGRLYGLVHDGLWFHVGTPEDLAETEQYLGERRFSLKTG
jgi:N-acetyl-alpha-D-muramate 1-phosphate uridylyltransferase